MTIYLAFYTIIKILFPVRLVEGRTVAGGVEYKQANSVQSTKNNTGTRTLYRNQYQYTFIDMKKYS